MANDPNELPPDSQIPGRAMQQAAEMAVNCSHVLELFCIKLSDGLDHPDLWSAWPYFLEGFPGLLDVIDARLFTMPIGDRQEVPFRIAHALCKVANGEEAEALESLEAWALGYGNAPQVLGATAYLRGLQESQNAT